jgi:cation diffusion facilitator family transporter
MSPAPQFPHPSDAGESRHAAGRRITWVSVVVNLVLTAMQVVVGWLAHSQSLIADAMHTLSDIVADVFVLYANRKGAEAADADHPYGHGRYETAASLVLGVLLAITGVGILLAAAQRLLAIESAPPVGQAALWAAVATLIGKELLFRYMLRTAERVRSPMLVANAWHARADALSSLVVAVGIGSALLGFNFADAVAAIIVGAMIVRVGLRFTWEALRELIDTGLDDAEVEAIRATLRSTPGVIDLHELRTRRMAHQVLVDAHVQVDPRISVSEGHRIGELARAQVLAAHDSVLDVLVHIDAEDDLGAGSRLPLPDRREIHAALASALGIAPDAMQATLHYLANGVEVDLYVADEVALDPGRLQRITRPPWLADLRLAREVKLPSWGTAHSESRDECTN